MREEPVRAHVDDEALGSAVDPGRDQAVGERLEPGVGFEHPELAAARAATSSGATDDADPDRRRDPLSRRLVPGTAAADAGARFAAARAATARRLVLGCHAGQASEGRDRRDRRKS